MRRRKRMIRLSGILAVVLACVGAVVGVVSLGLTAHAGRAFGYEISGSYIGYVCRDATAVGSYRENDRDDGVANYGFVGWGFDANAQQRSDEPYTQEIQVESSVHPFRLNLERDRIFVEGVDPEENDPAVGPYTTVYGFDLLPWNEVQDAMTPIVIEVPEARLVAVVDNNEIRASDYYTTVVRDCLLNTIEVDLTVGTEPGECSTDSSLTTFAGEDIYYCVSIWNASNLVTQDSHRIQMPSLGIDVEVEGSLGPGETLQLTNLQVPQLGPVSTDTNPQVAEVTVTSSNRSLYFSVEVVDEEDAFETFPASAQATVTAQDPPGNLRFREAAQVVDEGGGSVNLVVERVGGSTGSVEVDYVVMGGTASSGADYSGADGTLQFAPGETSATITVNIIEDSQSETDESIIIQIQNATGGAETDSPSAATVVIRDNDQPSCSNLAYLPLVTAGGFGGVDTCVPSEDSDNVDDAITIASGQRVGSTVNGSDLVDVYRFSVESGTNISLSLSGSGGDADLFLFDPTTTDVWIDPFVAGSMGLTSEEQIDWNADMTGYWYAVVLAYSGSIDYELSLSLGGEFGAAAAAAASSPNGGGLEDYRGTK